MDKEENVQDTPEVEPAGQELESTPDGGDLEPAPDNVLKGGPGLDGNVAPEFKPKHKSWEETEKARSILEKDYHTAKGETAQLKKKLETLERTFQGMGGKKEEQKVDTPRSRIIKAVQEKIKQYDQQLESGKISSEEHSELVMDAWAEANEKLADERVQARLSEHDQRSNQITLAENIFKRSGLSLMVKDEATGEDVDVMQRAFWLLSHDPGIPKNVSIQEEAEWICDQLKTFKAAVINQFKEEQTGKKTDEPLGKGVKTPKIEEEEGPATIGDALKKGKEQRRIKSV